MYFDLLMCPSLPGLCCNGSTKKKKYGEQFLKNIFAPSDSKLAIQCKIGKGTVAFKYHTYSLQYMVLVSILSWNATNTLKNSGTHYILPWHAVPADIASRTARVCKWSLYFRGMHVLHHNWTPSYVHVSLICKECTEWTFINELYVRTCVHFISILCPLSLFYNRVTCKPKLVMLFKRGDYHQCPSSQRTLKGRVSNWYSQLIINKH